MDTNQLTPNQLTTARQSPDAGAALHQLALALSKEGRILEAVEAQREAVAAGPDRPLLQLRLCDLLMQQGDLRGAERAIAAAIAQLPAAGALHAQLGRLLLKLGRLDEAAAAFRAAIAVEPGTAPHHAQLSHVLARAGDAGGAVAAIRQAIALGPGSAGHQAHLGGLLARLDDLEGAKAAFRQALALDPGHAESAARLAALEAAPEPRAAAEGGQEKRVVVGVGGFLFHDVDAAFEQICGGGMNPAEAARLTSLWEARLAWCAMRGIAYRVLIVPERHVLYPERLPHGYAPHEDRPALRLLRGADPALRAAVIYPAAEMIAARAAHEVCYRRDVHWTRYGAYVGYRVLMASMPELAPETLPESALKVGERRVLGDMAMWTGERAREVAAFHEPPAVAVREAFSTKTFKTGQVDVYETDHPSGRRLVLFRTSNSTALLPLLYHHFTRIVAVATTAVHFDLLRDERPDVVISELPERYLGIPAEPRGSGRIRFPRDFEAESFAEATRVTLPLPGVTHAGAGPPR